MVVDVAKRKADAWDAEQQQPPAKQQRRMATALGGRFGFKAPTVATTATVATPAATLPTKAAGGASLLGKPLPSTLPAPASRSGLPLPKRSPRGAPAESVAESVAEPPATRLRDAFLAAFAADRVASLEQLLQFRAKASKFNAKARQDEQLAYIRQLKAAVRAVCDEIRSYDAVVAALDETVRAERAAAERRVAVLEDALRSKEAAHAQSREDARRLTTANDAFGRQVQRLQQEHARALAAAQQSSESRLALEARAERLQTQLQQAQTQHEQLALDLKAQQAALADRVQLYEEKKRELQHFYERKDSEEGRRKSGEIERVQATLSSVRAELAAATQEKESLKDRAKDCENELKQERERRSHLEMEKCTLDAQNQSLEARHAAAGGELSELKAKLKQKEEEIMKMLTTMTEIQKFTSSANTKLEAEKRELVAKIEALQRTVRDLERAEVENASALRDLHKQLEINSTLRLQAEQKEQEALAKLRAFEAGVQENARQLSVEIGVRQMLENQVRELRNEHVAVNAQMEATRSEMKMMRVARDAAEGKASAQAAAFEAQREHEQLAFQREAERLREDKVSLESEVKTLRERVSSARDGDLEELCTVKREAEVLRLRLKELSNQGTQTVAQKDKLIEELQEKVKVGDKLRRTMHNTIQELRGNVRVFARTRPFLPSDRAGSADPVPAISCEYDGQTMKLKKPSKGGEFESHAFSFDKVFAPSMGQDAVFDEVSEFMQGSGNGQMRGIIPRSIEKVLHECELLKLQGWTYKVQASFLEIYNETLRDLLAAKDPAEPKLGIKKDAKGGVYVPDLTLVDVTASAQVEALMERASRARSVACTDMNAQSSRSHSVFTLHLQGVNDAEGGHERSISSSRSMGPKKGKKPKEKKDDGAENGGVLTPEEQAKLFLSANRSLQMQLAERHELAVKAIESKRELQERVSDLQRDFERERVETFGITQDMTRQYKSMQEELLNRVNSLENANTELRDQLELGRVNFEEMKREKDRVIASKNVEIHELKAKMEEMAQEFGDMLKETLDKMRERIEITNTSFEGDGGTPMIRRLEEFNLGSPTKL
ncbi:hypothetical protein PybrP1_007019 [[Pythium] brassicae (nom. inval.)]|nr:hypothetical protein PybrP1_007019 [[Pythium] brassicae (nom. inval.)]